MTRLVNTLLRCMPITLEADVVILLLEIVPLVVLPSPIADFDYNREFSSTEPRAGIIEFTNLSVGATIYWWDFEKW